MAVYLFIYFLFIFLGERETTGVTGAGVRLGGGVDSSQSGGKEEVRRTDLDVTHQVK